MAINNPYAKLKQDSIYTATPEELTLMLYDGAVKFGNQALIALEQKDFAKANTLIQKMQNIIREFQFTLKKGYDISEQLNNVYDYIHRILVKANINKDKEKLEEALSLIRELRDAWKEAMKIARAEKKGGNINQA